MIWIRVNVPPPPPPQSWVPYSTSISKTLSQHGPMPGLCFRIKRPVHHTLLSSKEISISRWRKVEPMSKTLAQLCTNVTCPAHALWMDVSARSEWSRACCHANATSTTNYSSGSEQGPQSIMHGASCVTVLLFWQNLNIIVTLPVPYRCC